MTETRLQEQHLDTEIAPEGKKPKKEIDHSTPHLTIVYRLSFYADNINNTITLTNLTHNPDVEKKNLFCHISVFGHAFYILVDAVQKENEREKFILNNK